MACCGHIVGLGGSGDPPAHTALLHTTSAGSPAKDRPMMSVGPTASAYARYNVWFMRDFLAVCRCATLMNLPLAARDLREVVLGQTPICVTAAIHDMLAILARARIDELMREVVGERHRPVGPRAPGMSAVRERNDRLVRSAARGMDCLGFLRGARAPLRRRGAPAPRYPRAVVKGLRPASPPTTVRAHYSDRAARRS